jgi:hypothetical protein
MNTDLNGSGFAMLDTYACPLQVCFTVLFPASPLLPASLSLCACVLFWSVLLAWLSLFVSLYVCLTPLMYSKSAFVVACPLFPPAFTQARHVTYTRCFTLVDIVHTRLSLPCLKYSSVLALNMCTSLPQLVTPVRLCTQPRHTPHY